MPLGEKIRALRSKLNVNQTVVADNIGVVVSTYSQYENNIQKPNYVILNKLAKYYGVSLDFLINQEDNVNDDNNLDTDYLLFESLLNWFVASVRKTRKVMYLIDNIDNAKLEEKEYNERNKYLQKALEIAYADYRSSRSGLKNFVDIGNMDDEIEEYFIRKTK